MMLRDYAAYIQARKIYTFKNVFKTLLISHALIVLLNFVMQCTTQRVYSNRDLFKTLTSMNIARDLHNRIIYRSVEL